MIRSVLSRAALRPRAGLSRCNAFRSFSATPVPNNGENYYEPANQAVTADKDGEQEFQEGFPYEKPKTFVDVVRRFGIYPMALLGGAALLSKELYIVDAQSLMLATGVFQYTVAYILFGDSFNKAVEEEHVASQKKITDVWDLELALLKTRINELKIREHFPAFLEKLKAVEVDSMTQLHQAKTKEMHVKATQAVKKELENAVTSLQAEQDRANANAVGEYITQITADLSAVTGEEQSKYLDSLIAQIGTVGTDEFDGTTNNPLFRIVGGPEEEQSDQ